MLYKWLRNTHLATGLFCVLFVLMYGVSSVQMAHNTWFTVRPTVSELNFSLTANASGGREAARELMDRHGLAGELIQIRDTPGGYGFRIVTPGRVAEVTYNKATGETLARVSKANFLGMLNRIHHLAGLWHEYPLMNAWSLALGLVSLMLLVLGITGLYMWFKIHTERLVGAVLLSASLLFSLTVMVLLRTA